MLEKMWIYSKRCGFKEKDVDMLKMMWIYLSQNPSASQNCSSVFPYEKYVFDEIALSKQKLTQLEIERKLEFKTIMYYSLKKKVIN